MEMATTRIAIVTGSNKGIGFATVRGLCKQFDGDVFLTARDPSRGQEVLSKLTQDGLEPRFHQLDINDETSVNKLAEFVKEKYGGVDVLVNNAAIAYKRDSPAPVSEQAEGTIQTNFWGTMRVCKAFFPLLKPGARVVNFSSMNAGSSWKKLSDGLKQKCRSCKTVDDVGEVMDQFVQDAKADTLSDWPNTCYGVGNIGISLVTPIQQQDVDPDQARDILINSCCPGYVRTDMSSHKGNKTIDEGADTPVYLALLPPRTDIRGKYVTERKVEEWRD